MMRLQLLVHKTRENIEGNFLQQGKDLFEKFQPNKNQSNKDPGRSTTSSSSP